MSGISLLSKRVIMVVTFLATLVLPVQQAILVGVFLSLVDYAYSSSESIELLEIRFNEDDQLVEQAPPQRLADNSITVLFSRGNSYFAAMRTLAGKTARGKTCAARCGHLPPAQQHRNRQHFYPGGRALRV